MAKECDDNIIAPTAGNSPACGVTQVSQYFNATAEATAAEVNNFLE